MRLDDPKRVWNLNECDLAPWKDRKITLHQTSKGLLLLMQEDPFKDALPVFPLSFSTRYNEDGAGNRPWWEPVTDYNNDVFQSLLAESRPCLPEETYSEAELEAALSFAEI